MHTRNLTWGGKLKDIPVPHRRKYSDRRRKRLVTVKVHRYVPNPHYFVELIEDDDPIWCQCGIDEDVHWHLARDDHAGKGRNFTHAKFNTSAAAYDWIRRKLKREFLNHRVMWQPGKATWFYREGA